MTKTMHIVGICGSLRAGSFNAMLLRTAQELVPPGVEIERVEIAGFGDYNDDVRSTALPAEVARFRQQVADADAVLFVTPEYNRSIPGLLKNAIDWISRPPDQPFANKPVAIMGASRGKLGTIMANHHLRQVLAYLGAQVLNGPEVLVGEAPAKFTPEGRLTDDPTRAFIAAHLDLLRRYVLMIHAGQDSGLWPGGR